MLATILILDICLSFIQFNKVMKRETLLTLIAVTLAALATAETAPVYTAAEAAKHVGETATVMDRIDGVYQSDEGNIFLAMGGAYPNQAFTAFIPSTSASKFSDPEQCQGRELAISGRIILYRESPEIIVTSASQMSAH
jgi:hypothetical protein